MITSQKKALTYLDLFRYESLRSTTICFSFLCCFGACLYFAPLLIVNEFGFDFYINGIIANCSELAIYPFAVSFIKGASRKKLCKISLIIQLLCSLALTFINNKEVCQKDCWNGRLISELILFFILRFFGAVMFSALLLFVSEQYPSQVAALGLVMAISLLFYRTFCFQRSLIY